MREVSPKRMRSPAVKKILFRALSAARAACRTLWDGAGNYHVWVVIRPSERYLYLRIGTRIAYFCSDAASERFIMDRV
jgi:hypothetical protein